MGLEIQTGEPHADGRYLCYVENEFLPAFTDPKILMHHNGEWFHPMSDQRYRGIVFGWVFIPIRKVADFAVHTTPPEALGPSIVIAEGFELHTSPEYDL